MADPKPLWEVMLSACLQAADDHPHQVNACYAAELRALADKIELRFGNDYELSAYEVGEWLRSEARKAAAEAEGKG